MARILLVAVCAGGVLLSWSSAEARNRLFRLAMQEEIPAPRFEGRAQSAVPALEPLGAEAQRLPLQHGPGYQKKHVKARYVQHFPRRTCCGCKSSLDTVLTVQDPRTHCLIDVPVCIPGCCTGKPSVHAHAGVFGRGVTAFHWACGYKARVVVDRRGDVTVHYFGR